MSAFEVIPALCADGWRFSEADGMLKTLIPSACNVPEWHEWLRTAKPGILLYLHLRDAFATLLPTLTADERDELEAQAAILEFEGNYCRAEAEARAAHFWMERQRQSEDQYHFTLDRVARRLPDGNFEDRLHFDIDRAFDSQEVQPI